MSIVIDLKQELNVVIPEQSCMGSHSERKEFESSKIKCDECDVYFVDELGNNRSILMTEGIEINPDPIIQCKLSEFLAQDIGSIVINN